MKAIFIGAGGTTRQLLSRLGDAWDVTVIDLDATRLHQAQVIRQFDAVVGDGSSRVVLERAGLDEADALVAAAPDDDVNLEAVSIALGAGLLRVLAVAAHPERLEDYRRAGVVAFSPAVLTARNIEVRLEPRRVSAISFAEGKGEAMEFFISSDSPVQGKALRDLHSERYLIAAILREGTLIVPHGDDRLQVGDLVTVVGDARDFGRIISTFTGGEPNFPLAYGRRVAVTLGPGSDQTGLIREATQLVAGTRAESLLVITTEADGPLEEALDEVRDRYDVEVRTTTRNPLDLAGAVAREEGIGVIVAAAPNGNLVARRTRVRRMARAAERGGVPLLVARSSHPYKVVLAPAERSSAGDAAARAAIDLSRRSGARLVGAGVVAPAFLAGGESQDDVRTAIAWLREEAAVQGVAVRRRIRQGNPVRVLVELAEDADLLVLGVEKWPSSALTLGPAGHLMLSSPISVLAVPAVS